MTTRAKMLIAGTLGAIWALGVVWVGATVLNVPIYALTTTLYTAFLAPGLVMALMVFWIAVRRFLNPDLSHGAEPVSGSAAAIDQSVLRNTVEQLVLALALWPAIGFWAADDGPGLLLALSLSFALMRLVYWAGYRISPPLRMFGWSATFYATLFALAWSVAVWVV